MLLRGLHVHHVATQQDLRLVEDLLEVGAALHGDGVRLPGELLADHLEVAAGHHLVPDVGRVACHVHGERVRRSGQELPVQGGGT